MADREPSETIVAEQYLERLLSNGIRFIFANGGTDFAPLVHAYVQNEDRAFPTPIAVPHEGVAVAMAHGYFLVTGEAQAVMVHVNVGTANALCSLINASRDNIPLLMTAGRSPLTESGSPASRDGLAQWAQEMFDQAGMVREVVKWDYELRLPELVPGNVDRAVQVMRDLPAGPVYLSLPREVLSAPAAAEPAAPAAARPGVPGPDPRAIDAACAALAGAERPLIITRCHGADAEDARAIAGLAHGHAIPVVEFRLQTNVLPTGDPMLLGYDPGPYLARADAILVVENDVPWIPAHHGAPATDATVIHVATDPGFRSLAAHGFRRDIAVASKASLALDALGAALAGRDDWCGRREDRRQWVSGLQETAAQSRATAFAGAAFATPIDPRWATQCVAAALPDDALIFNEYPLLPPFLTLGQPRQLFGMPSAGGLGWAMGAAMGAKLAMPDRFVVAAMGDGTYMLNNPVAAHHVAEACDLPILHLVFNNAAWMAVPRSAERVFPGTLASAGNRKLAFTHLSPSPRFERGMDAFGGYSDTVSDPARLPDALKAAVEAVQRDRVQALVNIHVT